MELDQILAESVEEAIDNNERNKRLVWYRLPPLPSVQNSESASNRPHARGERYSENEIVIERNEAKSDRQLIHRPEAKRELEREVQAANIVAQSPAPSSLPSPSLPSQPKAAPRKAVIPENRPAPAAAPKALEAPPDLAPSASPLTTRIQAEIARLPKPAPKKFVPPQSVQANRPPARDLEFGALPTLNTAVLPVNGPGSAEIAKLPKMAPKAFKAPPGTGGSAAEARSKSIDFGSTPTLAASGTSTSPGEQAVGAGSIPKLVRRKWDAAALTASAGTGNRVGSGAVEAPPSLQSATGNSLGGTGLGGTARTDIAVIGLSPGAGLPPPDANLRGSFSRGREVGAPAHVGNNDPNAVRVPGVSSRPGPGGPIKDLRLASPEQILGKEAVEGYFEIRLDLARQWPKLSAALAPNSRMLPRRIEPHLRGRSVFAVVIPMEKVDRYTTDWIVWFAPKLKENETATPLPGNTKMEAPLPIWKLESRRWLVSGGEQGVEQRVQMLVEINREGRVQVKELLGRFGVEMNQLVTNDLTRWVFQPARQNGQAIDVDAVLEIPFRVPSALQVGQNASPIPPLPK